MDVKILVAGIGNILMKDDGIGIYLCQWLKNQNIEGIEVQEFGLEIWRFLNIANNFARILIVDAVDMDLIPGSCGIFNNIDSVDSYGFSSHSQDIIAQFHMLQANRKTKADIFLFGIQPEKVEWGIGLSKKLNENFYTIAAKLQDFIKSLVKGEIYALH